MPEIDSAIFRKIKDNKNATNLIAVKAKKDNVKKCLKKA